MRLFRYLGLRTLFVYVGIAFSLATLALVVELVDNISRLNVEAGAALMFGYLFERTLVLMVELSPVALLMAAMAVASAAARAGELLAAQAVGTSGFRIAGTFVLLAVMVSTVHLATGRSWLPALRADADEMRRDLFGAGLFGDREQSYEWFRIEDHLLFLPGLTKNGEGFVAPKIYRLDEEQRVDQVVDGRSLVQRKRGWVVTRPIVHHAQGGLEKPSKPLPLALAPESVEGLLAVSGDPPSTPTSDLRLIYERRLTAGLEAKPFMAEIIDRWAQPLLILSLILAVSPWLMDPARDRTLAGSLVVATAAYGLSLTAYRVLGFAAADPGVPVVLPLFAGPLTMWVPATLRRFIRGA